MARETHKAKIERLEVELIKSVNTIEKLKRDIEKLKSEAEQNIKMYESELKTNEELFLQNQEFHKLINEKNKKLHNERGAGRPNKFSNEEIAMIQMYRFQGKKLQEIADMFCCSVGLIHKLINKK